MVDYVRQEIAKQRDKTRGDRAGVIVFGGEPAIELPPYDEDLPLVSTPKRRIDREHTNLAGAMKLAQASFPHDTAKRVVMLTDGNQNIGDALEQARALAEAGIGIDVVPIRYQPRGEVVGGKSHDPSGRPPRPAVRSAASCSTTSARRGRRMRRRSTAGCKSSQHRKTGDQRARSLSRSARSRSSRANASSRVREEIDEPDFYTYEARFVPDDVRPTTPMPQNNQATTFTHVRGSGQVLLHRRLETSGRIRLAGRAAAAR